jgi:hypothetical protein
MRRTSKNWKAYPKQIPSHKMSKENALGRR